MSASDHPGGPGRNGLVVLSPQKVAAEDIIEPRFVLITDASAARLTPLRPTVNDHIADGINRACVALAAGEVRRRGDMAREGEVWIRVSGVGGMVVWWFPMFQCQQQSGADA